MNKDQMQGWIREITGKLRTGLGKTIGSRRVAWRGARRAGRRQDAGIVWRCQGALQETLVIGRCAAC